MRAFIVASFVVLLSSCASHTSTGGSSGAKDQVAAATAASRAAYNSRDPALIVVLYDQEAVFLGAQQRRRLAQTRLRLPNTSRTPKSAPTPGLRLASNIFECTAMWP